MQALGRFLIVEIEEEKQEEAGLVRPDLPENQDAPGRGKIVSVGKHAWMHAYGDKFFLPDIDELAGKTVLFRKYGADEIEHEGKKHLAIEDRDVIAVL